MKRAVPTILCQLAGTVALSVAQTPVGSISIDLKHYGHSIPSKFYGLMTEEINHAYDGGLYAELIQNRSFRDSGDHAAHWSLVGSNGNLTFKPGEIPSIEIESSGAKTEVANDGFWGIGCRPETTYRAVVRARSLEGNPGPIELSIQSTDGARTYAMAKVSGLGKDWKNFTVNLHSGPEVVSGPTKFVLGVTGTGKLEVNFVSLFPPTFHGRKNGTRPDLMALLSGLKPSFLRLPGGNYLEGNTIATRFEWKDTLGAVENRPGHQGPWGYRSSDGLGLLEFLEWCEDLKMDPLLAVYAGYSLEGAHVNPGPDLAPFVQDGLDEIEYVTGPTSSKWGAQRAKDGHPKPFPLEYVEVGNEDAFDHSNTYGARFAQFFDAIRAQYPKLKIISTAKVDTRRPDLVDDHYYRTGSDMASDSGHYDNYDRTQPKIFVGEWASTEGRPTPNMQAALGDAAWLTGLERDSDVVLMEAYAPLLVNVNRRASQWPTNLIGYDALTSFGSPSYFVQSMYAAYTGDVVIPSKINYKRAETALPIPTGSVGLGTWRTASEYKDLKVTQGGKVVYQSDFSTGNSGLRAIKGTWALSDGAYKETAIEEGTLATVGDPTWQDFTYTLKARKLSGAEGFIIPFHVSSDHKSFWQWNIGGWRNTRTRIQRVLGGSNDEIGNESNVTVETNRWYDLRIEAGHGEIRCYLDGKLVSQAKEEYRTPADDLYVAVSKKLANGHVFVKVVNFSASNLSLSLDLGDASGPKKSWTGWELVGEPADMNTISQPAKISPKKISASSLVHTFPAHSVTVLEFRG